MSEPSSARQRVNGIQGAVAAHDGGGGADRMRLLAGPLALVENLRSPGARLPMPRMGPPGFSSDFQVVLPYRGLFVWHVGDDDVVSDPGLVLFVSGGEPYRVSQPLPGGYGELIITPSLSLLAELLATSAASLPSHPLFRRRHRRADLGLQLLRARFLHRANDGGWDPLQADDLVLAILRCALEAAAPAREPSRSTRQLIGRTKEFVAWHLAESFRLADVARAVGASPTYLTDVFSRFEGVPLHQYAVQLRLSRALAELPHADDLTKLAMDLGFSSHSHFTETFRHAFGCTPSAFRAATRSHRQRQRVGWRPVAAKAQCPAAKITSAARPIAVKSA